MFFSLPAGPLDRVRLSRKNREIVAIAAFVDVHFMNKKLLRKWHRSSEERHYYHPSRCHMALDGNAPEPHPVEPPSLGKVVAITRVGGLHPLYRRSG
jgi:hypothetical protein